MIMNDLLQEFIAGGIAGMAGVFVTYPVDTIKVHQQVNEGSKLSITKTAASIWRSYGYRGFYRGMLVPLITNGFVFAVFFASYTATLEWYAYKDGRLKRHPDKVVEDLATYEEIFKAGCIGGFAQSFLAGPVELIKVQMQIGDQKRPSAVRTINKLWAYRGYRGMGMGLGATFLRDVHSHGFYTLADKMYLDIFCYPIDYPGPRPKGKENPFGCLFMAGGFAGLIYWWSCLPMDVIKSRMQGDSIEKPVYKNSYDCMKKIYREGGIKLFFRGTLATTIRAFPSNGCVFLAHKEVNDLFNKFLHKEKDSR